MMRARGIRRPPSTTDAGIPVAIQEHSLTVGPCAIEPGKGGVECHSHTKRTRSPCHGVLARSEP